MAMDIDRLSRSIGSASTRRGLIGGVASALAAATHLALAFDCDRVAIGTIRRGHSRVAAISHSATFGKHMLLVAKLSAAMDEARRLADEGVASPGTSTWPCAWAQAGSRGRWPPADAGQMTTGTAQSG